MPWPSELRLSNAGDLGIKICGKKLLIIIIHAPYVEFRMRLTRPIAFLTIAICMRKLTLC